LHARRTIGRVTDSHDSPSLRRPAGFCRGPGHVVVYGNAAFIATYGATAVGMPAREAMVDLPSAAFALLDTVLGRGKPLARWVRIEGQDWRMTAAPRIDLGTGEVYGVAFHLRARGDTPVVASELPSAGSAG
jgi:hypothetical protein